MGFKNNYLCVLLWLLGTPTSHADLLVLSANILLRCTLGYCGHGLSMWVPTTHLGDVDQLPMLNLTWSNCCRQLGLNQQMGHLCLSASQVKRNVKIFRSHVCFDHFLLTTSGHQFSWARYLPNKVGNRNTNIHSTLSLYFPIFCFESSLHPGNSPSLESSKKGALTLEASPRRSGVLCGTCFPLLAC